MQGAPQQRHCAHEETALQRRALGLVQSLRVLDDLQAEEVGQVGQNN